MSGCECLTELLRPAALDGAAVTEDRGVEVERRQLLQAALPFIQALVAERVAEVRQVRAGIGGEEQAPPRPEQRDLTGALTRNVNRLQSSGDGQLGAVVDLLIDRARIDRRSEERRVGKEC